MNSKKYIYWFAISAFFAPLVLSFLPLKKELVCANNNRLTPPVFNRYSFLADSALVESKEGQMILTPNSFLTKSSLINQYTQNIAKYASYNFGLSNIYVKSSNQIDYSLFNQASRKGIIMGKNNFFFEEKQLQAYYGSDFIGTKTITKQLKELNLLQQKLTADGKLLLIVIAPSKASFYPEFIPSSYGISKAETNYKAYLKALKSTPLHYIDFSAYFKNRKTKDKNILYHKTGSMWTTYAALQAADSILKYSSKLQRLDLRNYKINTKVKKTSSLHYFDQDQEEKLNLFVPMANQKLTYPTISYGSSDYKDKISILTIGDDFYKPIYSLGIIKQVAGNERFWLRNEYNYHNDNVIKATDYISNKKLYNQIKISDVIILMCSETNLDKLGYGFVQEASKQLELGKLAYKKRITEIIAKMKSTPKWLAEEKQKAKERGLGLEEMLLIDADYVYKEEARQNEN
jgi:hypothetical protein